MKTESKQKLATLAFSGFMAYAVAALIPIGGAVAFLHQDSPGTMVGIAVIVFLALGVGLFGLRFIGQSGYRFSKGGMVVARPLGTYHIDYASVSRVERVTRSNSRRTEKVRLTFDCLGKDRVVTITPESSGIVVAEILSRCPRLTSSTTHRLKRDGTFRAAREVFSRTSDKARLHQQAKRDAVPDPESQPRASRHRPRQE
jgi:hypothetical protein